MTAFCKTKDNGCRVTDKPGQNEIISDPLGIIFLKKQKNKIGHGAEHVEQYRNNDQNFHYLALVGFRVLVKGFKGSGL